MLERACFMINFAVKIYAHEQCHNAIWRGGNPTGNKRELP